MNTRVPSVTYAGEPEVDRWLTNLGAQGEPAVVDEVQQVAARIVRRIHFLRCTSPGSREWVEAEMDLLRRRLVTLANSGRVREVPA